MFWYVFFSQELSLASAEAGGQVNVCVDAAPSMDLNQAMTEIRQHNEAVTEKKQKELESWYETKVKLKPQMHLYLSDFITFKYYFGILSTLKLNPCTFLCFTTSFLTLKCIYG